MKRNQVAYATLLLLVCLNASVVHKTSAPPLSSVYTFGLVSSINTDVWLSHATVNISNTPDLIGGENLTHDIETSSFYNISNTADYDVYFPVSFVWNDWTPYEISSNLETNVSIEGNHSNYNASIVYNITSREDLPVEISYRFPADFFLSYSNPRIDLINITLAPHAELVLRIESKFVTECWGNYLDLRYGLDMQKLEFDSTQLISRLSVSNTSLFVKTDLLNNHGRSVTQEGDSLVVMWAISDWEWGGEATYPGMQFNDDVFTDYLGVQLWQSEYNLPIHDAIPDFGGIPLFFPLVILILVVSVVVFLRRVN
ncbi:MAG: hypothetical protein ACFFF9_09025 [Candidatus Thorarchaeota archaeon]